MSIKSRYTVFTTLTDGGGRRLSSLETSLQLDLHRTGEKVNMKKSHLKLLT